MHLDGLITYDAHGIPLSTAFLNGIHHQPIAPADVSTSINMHAQFWAFWVAESRYTPAYRIGPYIPPSR
jgi:hypothetical protein